MDIRRTFSTKSSVFLLIKYNLCVFYAMKYATLFTSKSTKMFLLATLCLTLLEEITAFPSSSWIEWRGNKEVTGQ